MNRELQIHKLVPVIIEPDQIGLDIEADLNENDDGVDFAVPNVAFEVRIGVQKVYEGKSNPATGRFIAKNIPLDKFGASFEVVISAKDEVCGLTVRVQIDATSVIAEIEEKRRKMEDQTVQAGCDRLPVKIAPEHVSTIDSAPQKPPPTPEMAEMERQVKEAVRGALAQLLKRRYFEQTISFSDEPHLGVYFDVDDGKWKNSSTNIECDVHDYRMPSYKHVAMHSVEPYLEKAFAILIKNDGHPLVRRGVFDVVKQHPEVFLDPYYEYFKAGWAEMVLLSLAKCKPASVLSLFKKFYKFDWAKNVLLKIAEDFPELLLDSIEIFEYQPWAEEVATRGAQINPSSAIRHYDKYQDQPWAAKVLAFAHRGGGEK